MIFSLMLLACNRPTSSYEVNLHGEGTSLDEIHGPATPMSGYVEYARFRLWGKSIGHGFTSLYGDTPYASGTSLILGIGNAAYPPDPSFDHVSPLITMGPKEEGTCFTKIGGRSEPWSTEYIDLGDHIALTSETVSARLERDPTLYPDPAGETWYIGYGNALLPVLTDYPHRQDNWPQLASELQVSFSGTLPPKETMVGAIPYPASGTLSIPPAISSPAINGVDLEATSTSFDGPWESPLTVSWLPSTPSAPLILSIRAVGQGDAQGSCTCDADCGTGMGCLNNQCYSLQGSSDAQLGELVCTLQDNGSFSITPDMIAPLLEATQINTSGYLLVLARATEGTINELPDTLSYNGRRIPTAPMRTRGIDAIITRLEGPK
jgi:hypothetical protein